MKLPELSFDDQDNIDLSDLDDDSVLADGMIPDSRIVELIDQLKVISDDPGNEDDFANELAFLGLHQYFHH
jgi:hypothetical protein